MDGKQSLELTQILNAIEEGGYGKDELVQRLNDLIDRELSRTEHPADMNLIDACQDLLYRLHNQGEAYTSNRSSSLARAQRKLRAQKWSLPSFIPFARVAALLALLIGGEILFVVFISGEHLFGTPTPDEQQYVVEGTDVDSILVTKVDAEQSNEMKVLSTESLEEASKLFGSTPSLPTWLPAGWEPVDYYVVISKRARRFEVQYSNEYEYEYIKYGLSIYNDSTAAQKEFEQNRTGSELIIKGTKVYVANNTGSYVAVWLTDNTCYSVTGPITEQDMCQIIQSIFRNGE